MLFSFIIIRLSCIFPFENSTNSLQGLEGINLRILHDDAVHVADRLEGNLRRRPSVIARVNIACAYGTLLCVRVLIASCFIVTRYFSYASNAFLLSGPSFVDIEPVHDDEIIA